MNFKQTCRYVALALMLGGSAGCSKWLDVKPKTQVGGDDLLTDEQGFKDALIGVYTGISGEALYGREFTMAMMDVLAANYDVAISTNNYNPAGRYDYTSAIAKDAFQGFWSVAYKNVANINNLLAKIDARKAAFAPAMYELVKGEALGLRAMLHFDMLRAFGPLPANGLDAKAIPYVTNFDMNVQPRLTAREVIARCMEDLAAARALLKVRLDVYYNHADIWLAHTRNHFNYWAATGLMARISLWAGDAPNAYAYAREVIDSKKWNLIPASAVNTLFPDRTFTQEHLFAVYLANMQALNAKHFNSLAASSTVLTNKNAFINARFESGSGGSTDYRYLYLWKTSGSSTTKYPAKYWIEDILGNGSWLMRRLPLIRYSEMFYIAAETAPDPGEAVAMLNEVRSHRGLQLLPASISAEQLKTEIAKEYRKEFYQEGQLFFFYKRTNAAVLEGTSRPGNEAMYVLPMPDDEIEFNQN